MQCGTNKGSALVSGLSVLEFMRLGHLFKESLAINSLDLDVRIDHWDALVSGLSVLKLFARRDLRKQVVHCVWVVGKVLCLGCGVFVGNELPSTAWGYLSARSVASIKRPLLN